MPSLSNLATECSFTQPLMVLFGCQARQWPNSKLIHFHIDQCDDNNKNNNCCNNYHNNILNRRKVFPSVQKFEKSTWNSEKLLSLFFSFSLSHSTGDICNVMLQHPAMAISGIGFEIALHSEPWLRPSTLHHIIHQWDRKADGGGSRGTYPEEKGEQEEVLMKSGRDTTGYNR